MCKTIVCKENENLSYDEMCDKCSLSNDEYYVEYNTEDKYVAKSIKDNQYTREEIESCLKDSILSMISELKKVVENTFDNTHVFALYNDKIEDWNEVIASIKINDNLIELKLTNDDTYNTNPNFNSVFITLFANGKGIYTEYLERISEEYEFTGKYYAQINENELCFKDINKEGFIQKIISQISNCLSVE